MISESTGLESWKTAIGAANNAFIHGQARQALELYQTALAMAKASVSDIITKASPKAAAIEIERCLAALVVTQHNLADLLGQSDRLDEASFHLCAAHEYLFQLRHHPDVGLGIIAQRHLKITYRELIIFVQRHGPHKRITESLLLTQYLCDSCRQKGNFMN